MPRPRKWRNVCCLPESNLFGPFKMPNSGIIIKMSVEEYETIRLIDFEGMMQQECADKMNVARTTVQRIYNDARQKLADTLINGHILIIEGGDYRLCLENNQNCGFGKCNRHRCFEEKQEDKENEMIIAIPADEKSLESKVCVSFGRAPYFAIYDTNTKTTRYLDNSAAAAQGGAGINAAQLIVDNKVNVLLAPRCGENANDVLKSADIKIFKTMDNTIDNNIKAYLEGSLSELELIHKGFHNHGEKI